jgi:hypothetical protein
MWEFCIAQNLSVRTTTPDFKLVLEFVHKLPDLVTSQENKNTSLNLSNPTYWKIEVDPHQVSELADRKMADSNTVLIKP